MAVLTDADIKQKYPGTQMRAQAIQADENSGIVLYDVNKIYSDHDFNCRGAAVTPMDVIDLAQSIADKGLLAPIVIRPCGEQPTDPETSFEYVIVAGHRRFQAYRVNNHPVIPAVLRANETRMMYKSLNLIENLKRKDLNILEEAQAIEDYINAGWSRDQIAREIGQSPGWVQVRDMVLKLPEEIQNEIAAGILNSSHIRKLYSLKGERDKQLALALEIKKIRQRGDTSAASVEKVLTKDEKPKATSKKRRTSTEIEGMMEHLHTTFGEYGLTGRALAWAAGHIANYEFYRDIRDEAVAAGIDYIVPEMDI